MQLSELEGLSLEEKLELLELLETRDRRRRENWLQHYKPYAKQREFHRLGADHRERLFMAANQGHPLDFKVLTPSGWTPIGDLSPGDEVIAGDGTTTEVTGVADLGVRDIYEVSFDRGRIKVPCTDDHLWAVRPPQRGGYAVMTTMEVAERKSKLRTPGCSPVQFGVKDLPVDPYLLGLLLGDGSFAGNYVQISSNDEFILEEVRRRIPSTCVLTKSSGAHKSDWRVATLRQGRGRRNDLMDLLEGLGLRGKRSENKSVPAQYMLGSVEQRLAVLQGLMDTDGSSEPNGRATFYTTSPTLAENVRDLARSLGGRAHVSGSGEPSTYKHPKTGEERPALPAYTVDVRLPAGMEPFRLPRKIRPRPAREKSLDHIWEGVERIGEAPARCIKIAHPSSLYICEGYIVTHNSGKTYSGAAEVAYHATGLYPDWWEGYRFSRPIRAIVASESAELTRKGAQRLLLGEPEKREEWGTGAIPKTHLKGWSMKPGVPDAVSNITVKSEYGGESVVQFNSYDQGRMQRVDSRVLTPTGWRRIGDLAPGDEVIAGDGSATKVEGVFPHGVQELYELEFDSGVKTLAGAEHLWAVGERTKGRWMVRDTAWLVERYGDQGARVSGNRQVSTPNTGVVQLRPAPVPLDPYLVGALLGDGCLRGNRVQFTSQDPEIVALVAKGAEALGASLKRRSEIQYYFVDSKELRRRLGALGMMELLAHDKSVPECYLWNEPSVRFAVLQGLLDTDGSVSKKGTISFASTSRALAEDVAFLVRSFGGKARFGATMLKERKRPLFKLTIWMPGAPPFALTRKAKRCIRPETETYRHILRRVRKVDPGEAVCIAVAHPSQLYVTDDFIVTHNTKLQADTLDLAWLDEEPPADVYTEVLTRTNVSGGPMFITFTPLMGMSQVVKRFIKEKPAGTIVTTMTIDDVEHYTPERRAAIIAAYPEHEREARARGVPMMGSGQVFPVAESLISCEPLPIPPHWARICAIDFGWDHPAGFVCLAHDRDTDTVYVYDAWRMRKKSAGEQAMVIMGKGYRELPWAWPHDGLQHDKGAGQVLVKQYKDFGINMLPERAQFERTTEGKNGGNSVEAGIEMMLDRMQTRRLRVFSNLTEWFEEFRQYHRKDGVIVKEDDDLMSATRYGLMMLRKARTGSELVTTRPNLLAAGNLPTFEVLDSISGY